MRGEDWTRVSAVREGVLPRVRKRAPPSSPMPGVRPRWGSPNNQHPSSYRECNPLHAPPILRHLRTDTGYVSHTPGHPHSSETNNTPTVFHFYSLHIMRKN
jgi:hypothetical protein